MSSYSARRVTRILAATAALSLAVPIAGGVTATSAAGVSRAGAPAASMADDMDHVMIGPTGNTVEMVAPQYSTYVPDMLAASAADRAQSQALLDGVNEFCRTHTVAEIEAAWRPGLSNPSNPTHFFNPDPNHQGLNPANPQAALIFDGQLGGVMFWGKPLPSLGSIPRAHSHDMTEPVEMLHVYCNTSLKAAFTPNRMLGVMAIVKALRLKIRPAVGDLTKPHAREVRTLVRGYAGGRLAPVAPDWSTPDRGSDPVLEAMRIEIRASLMLLTETQLRSVWRLMRSY